jgi:glycosyltransferase involved in cell wall biosynthesis
MSKIVIINQSPNYLMRDIAQVFIEEYEEVVLMGSWPVNDMKTDLIKAYDKRSMTRRLITCLIATIQIFWKVIWKYQDYDLFIVSNPPTAPLLPLMVRNRFSLLIFDIYPDVLVNQHILSSNNLIIRWWKKRNRKIYAKAEHVFTISEGMKECLCQYVEADKIEIVPLWPNNVQIHQIKKCDNIFIKEHHLEHRFVVLYSGNLGSTHRMDVLVDVAKIVKDAVFLIIGMGAKKKLIEERIEKESCENVLLLPFQPLEKLSHVLSSADIAVVTLETGASQMSIPSKIFNLMAVGAPIMGIASPESALGKLIEKYEMGRTFSPDAIEGMAAFVCEVQSNTILKDRLSRNAQSASSHFTNENARLFIVRD